MDWLRSILQPAAMPSDSPRASPSERESLVGGAGVNREVSFADILRAAQQDPVETAVVKKENNLSLASQRAVDVTANSAAQDDTRLNIPTLQPTQPKQPAVQQQPAAQQLPAPPPTAQPTGTAHNIKAAAYGLTNLSSVVAIVFANKLVLFTHGFAFAATLTWLHCIFTAVGMIAMAAVGFFEIKRVPLAKSLPVAMVYVGTIVLNNLSIQLNTVGFYQISKIAITPVIVAIEYLFYSKSASPRVLASIVVLLSGIAMATITDSQVASKPLGMLVACINCVITGLYQVWAGSKQRELGLNGLQLLHQVAPSSVVLLAILIPFLEPVGFTNPGPGTILGYTLTPAAAFWIVVSSILGLVVTLSTFLFIGATSSLTYNVVGHMKTVLIVTGGVMLFGDSMSIKKFGGLVCAMGGIIWYSQIKMAEASKAGKQ